jgi:hypothetical protein
MDIFDSIDSSFLSFDLNFLIGNARMLRRTVAIVKEPKKVKEKTSIPRIKKVKKESSQMSFELAMEVLVKTDPERLMRILTGKESLKNG